MTNPASTRGHRRTGTPRLARQGPSATQAGLLGDVGVARQSAFRRQAVHTGEKALQAGKIRVSLALDEFLRCCSRAACQRCAIAPRLAVTSSLLTSSEARTANQPLVLSGRHEQVEPDRAPNGDSSCETRPVTIIASVNSMRPPGRSTRCQSVSTARRSGCGTSRRSTAPHRSWTPETEAADSHPLLETTPLRDTPRRASRSALRRRAR